MKTIITAVSIIFLATAMNGCSLVHLDQTYDGQANKNLVSKEKEEVWNHFAH